MNIFTQKKKQAMNKMETKQNWEIELAHKLKIK